ncbi:MAG: S8 family serine peptidase [Deltaproteobacteria bacterium]|nr:S8 family serine peptidase [Deltaproteobacteria bacterium]
MRDGLRSLVASAMLLSFVAIPGSGFAREPLKAEARRQIHRLLEEKRSRSRIERKLSSRLVLALKKRRGHRVARDLPSLRNRVSVDRSGRTLVDIRGSASDAMVRRIEALGGRVVNRVPRFGAIRARIPIGAVDLLAAESEVQSIAPAESYMLHALNASEGDAAHGADIARLNYGVDGSGVSICTLSDSVDELVNVQSTGDLPAIVGVLPGQSGIPGSSEGTAMMEIIHDLAPAAELFFASAMGGQAQFAQNILDLQAAGCDVIVDDVFYFAEPVFEDGVVAQAVATVVAAGVVYLSSAGNSGNLNDGSSGVWEGDYVSIARPSVVTFGEAHDFGGSRNYNTLTHDPPYVITLTWADSQDGSANDYDLFLLDSTLSVVHAASTDYQSGMQDPFEMIDSGAYNDEGSSLVVIRYSGEGRYLHLNTHRGRLEVATDGQIAGHSAAAAAISVAAVDVGDSQGAFTGGPDNPVEWFSSDGPRRIFFDPPGVPVTPGNFGSTGGKLRAKPDLAAADGVSTSTPGFSTFYGTSAAAPHAAAIAGLMLDRYPTLNPYQVRVVMRATALDIEAAGVDRDSGTGIIDPVAALQLGPSFFSVRALPHAGGLAVIALGIAFSARRMRRRIQGRTQSS